jgi:hypothetical protein
VSDRSLSIPSISRATDSESTWRRAREWIHWCTRMSGGHDAEQPPELCKQIHFACQRMIMDKKLPTRLVHISTNDRDVRLCITRDIEIDKENIKYIALTHCWGVNGLPVVTTRENLKQMVSRIPVSSLTKTFQDAITITRRLGLQYLWIDSL